MSVPNIPIVNLGNLYVSGLNLTYLTTTTFSVAAGQARDSSDVNDIVLDAAVTVNVRTNGVNGLDIGTLAANAIYYVFIVGDSTKYEDPCALISLSATAPVLPVGYDMFRRIGAIKGDATAAPNTLILPFHQRCFGLDRAMYYMTPIATAIAAGNALVWTDVILTTFVPTTATSVIAQSRLTSDAGGTRYALFAASALVAVNVLTVYEVIMTSAASVVSIETLVVPCTNTAGVMTCQYAVSDAAAALAVFVGGYIDSL
jgi:hypothetical protein